MNSSQRAGTSSARESLDFRFCTFNAENANCYKTDNILQSLQGFDSHDCCTGWMMSTHFTKIQKLEAFNWAINAEALCGSLINIRHGLWPINNSRKIGTHSVHPHPAERKTELPTNTQLVKLKS